MGNVWYDDAVGAVLIGDWVPWTVAMDLTWLRCRDGEIRRGFLQAQRALSGKSDISCCCRALRCHDNKRGCVSVHLGPNAPYSIKETPPCAGDDGAERLLLPVKPLGLAVQSTPFGVGLMAEVVWLDGTQYNSTV